MKKFIFNENIHGYEKLNINDIQEVSDRDDLYIIIADKSCDKDISSYYNLVASALKKNNRIIFISVDDDNKLFKPLASLMVTYNAYDIYQVAEKTDISAPYLLKIQERHPDLSEVQTYIGGDITAYSDLTTILFGIESLTDEGNEEALKSFLEKHMLSIESLVATLDYMKKTCDIFNSNELIDSINHLKDEIDKLNNTLEKKNKEIEEVKYDRDVKKVEAENLKRENNNLKNKNTDLQSQAESGGSVIKSYKEINTSVINCKTKLVIYFKEISYVKHVNTLILQLVELFKINQVTFKLLIYDGQLELGHSYSNMSKITGPTYAQMKSNLISNIQKCVVGEPNPAIIQDVLTSEKQFDVVIIYDRMKCVKDIVTGNNVTKFYVINSTSDFNEVKSTLKITDTSCVISNTSSSIYEKNDSSKTKKFLDIPVIEDYNKQTASGKTSKYMKLTPTFSKEKEPLIRTILKKSKIDMIGKIKNI